MNDELRIQIRNAFSQLTAGRRYAPASEAQLLEFEREIGVIPPDYRWFLKECGGGLVGEIWIDGIQDLSSSNLVFSSALEIPVLLEQPKQLFVLGNDLDGHPVVVTDAGVYVIDSESNHAARIADSFAGLLCDGLNLDQQ